MGIRARAVIEFHTDRNIVVTMENGEMITGGMIHRSNHLMKRESSKQRSAAVFKHRAEERKALAEKPPEPISNEDPTPGEDLSWLDGIPS